MEQFITKIPVWPDVRRLLDTFGQPEEKTEITYAAISDVIKAEYPSHRFMTVTNAWRSHMVNQHGINLLPMTGLCFRAAEPELWNEHARKRVKSRTRLIVRDSNRLSMHVDRERLSEAGKKNYDHVVAFGSAIQLAAMTAAKSHKPPILGK